MKKTSTNAKKKTSYNAIPIIMFNISRQSFFVSTSTSCTSELRIGYLFHDVYSSTTGQRLPNFCCQIVLL